ncbi:MAG: hypothetical protein A2Y48_09475 [Nitrospirae bacterium RIFCSPLOW2_12_42_9]|nr:MAG: hypothetical protein A3D21_00800 [Nitrospirae bacterium RIFCSPHIGHO2_02_FULL_42_12]OGW59514.1 MAG: hypothetical protein A2Y48_09475 [Nitrospirae bacterium RIFCSPLOW2_12_42_9]
MNILISMRPKQWIKNLFIFTPLIFSKTLFIYPYNLKSFMAFIIFCEVSGCVYIINDIADREEDKRHPLKRLRPIASGVLSTYLAGGTAAILMLMFLIGGYSMGNDFLAILFAYFSINLAYSIFLKHVVLLDIFVISLGFVLRVAGGGFAIDVEISSWLLLCTLLIALFLAMCKRRHELVLLEDEAKSHRKILGEYSPYFLDQLIAVVTASTLVTYALYTMSSDVYLKFGNNNLKYTIPFVLYGIFRYLYLVHQKDKGGSPTEIMMSDVPMLMNMGLWALVVGFALYF